MDAGIESEIKRHQSLESKLNVTLDRLDETNKKILNKYNKK